MKKFARSKPNWTRGRQHNRKFTSLRGKNARDKKGALNRDNMRNVKYLSLSLLHPVEAQYITV